jgi:hypothetical protein
VSSPAAANQRSAAWLETPRCPGRTGITEENDLPGDLKNTLKQLRELDTQVSHSRVLSRLARCRALAPVPGLGPPQQEPPAYTHVHTFLVSRFLTISPPFASAHRPQEGKLV